MLIFPPQKIPKRDRTVVMFQGSFFSHNAINSNVVHAIIKHLFIQISNPYITRVRDINGSHYICKTVIDIK